MRPKTATPEDFQVFKTEVKRLIKRFHIDGWNIYYEFGGTDNTCNASLTTDTTSRAASFKLAKKIYLYDDIEIKETALHEVCHLLLSDITNLAYCRFVSQDEVTKEDERTTEKLSSILAELKDAQA